MLPGPTLMGSLSLGFALQRAFLKLKFSRKVPEIFAQTTIEVLLLPIPLHPLPDRKKHVRSLTGAWVQKLNAVITPRFLPC
jgi:hypothetical protein